jgi:uncharacterized protein YecE (DUF72 family)
MHKVFIGTSGYNYRDWKERFYPPDLPSREWLRYFATQFPTVEINNSFYVATKQETYTRWYDMTPPDFQFSIKGHRMITQYKKLLHVEEEVALFFMNASALREKLAVILWQFPASFRIGEGKLDEHLMRLETFLKLLPKDIKHAFEFRDTSWFGKDVQSLLKTYNASLVYSDSPRFPLLEDTVQPFSYIRFHGPEALYASSYTDYQLQIWAEKIQRFVENGDVYVYFNNDINGHAVENARRLVTLVSSKIQAPNSK